MPDFFQDGLEKDDRGGKESRFHEVHLYTKVVHESVYKPPSIPYSIQSSPEMSQAHRDRKGGKDSDLG